MGRSTQITLYFAPNQWSDASVVQIDLLSGRCHSVTFAGILTHPVLFQPISTLLFGQERGMERWRGWLHSLATPFWEFFLRPLVLADGCHQLYALFLVAWLSHLEPSLFYLKFSPEVDAHNDQMIGSGYQTIMKSAPIISSPTPRHSICTRGCGIWGNFVSTVRITEHNICI